MASCRHDGLCLWRGEAALRVATRLRTGSASVGCVARLVVRGAGKELGLRRSVRGAVGHNHSDKPYHAALEAVHLFSLVADLK